GTIQHPVARLTVSNSGDIRVHAAYRQSEFPRTGGCGDSVAKPCLRLPWALVRLAIRRHPVSDAFLLLRPLTDFSGEIVLANSELFVYVNQLLAGVLEKETAG